MITTWREARPASRSMPPTQPIARGIVFFLIPHSLHMTEQPFHIIRCSKGFHRGGAQLRSHDTGPVPMKRYGRRQAYSVLAAGIVIFSCIEILQAFIDERFELDENLLRQAEQRYGMEARGRLIAWQNLIRGAGGLTEREKLENVNRFFNAFDFVTDHSHWGIEDYWATPVELIASNGGDCEDFALAKYFTLKALGVAENRLTLTYVKALGLDQAHMVLTYYPSPESVPLVLDNLVGDIRPASARTDLLPVYSFNGSGLWLAKQRGRGRFVGESDRLQRWKELLERMPQGLN